MPKWMMNLPTIYRGADDGSGSGGGGGLMGDHVADGAEGDVDGGNTGDTGGDGDGGGSGGSDGSSDGSGGDVERPDHIPEQFWNKEKGETDIEKMSKSYGELRNEMNRLKEEGGSKAPEKVEAYLEDFKMPTGEDGAALDRIRDVDAGDPLVSSFAEAAHKHGLSKEAFDGILSDVFVAMNGQMPEPYDEIAELEKLGGAEQGKAVVGLNKQFLGSMKAAGTITEQEYSRGLSMCSDALGVQLLDKLRVNSGEKAVPITLGQGGVGGHSKAELEAMFADPLYSDQTAKGEAYRAKVSKAVEESVGNAPASSSDQISFNG